MNRTQKITKQEMIDAQALFPKEIFKKEIKTQEKIENKMTNVENIFIKHKNKTDLKKKKR